MHGRRFKDSFLGQSVNHPVFLSDTICSKRSSEYFDPCQDFADKSIKCLHRNNGDKEICSDYFQ